MSMEPQHWLRSNASVARCPLNPARNRPSPSASSLSEAVSPYRLCTFTSAVASSTAPAIRASGVTTPAMFCDVWHSFEHRSGSASHLLRSRPPSMHCPSDARPVRPTGSCSQPTGAHDWTIKLSNSPGCERTSPTASAVDVCHSPDVSSSTQAMPCVVKAPGHGDSSPGLPDLSHSRAAR